MNKLDERLGLIGTAIISQAEAEAREIIDKANKKRDEEIASQKDDLIDAMFSSVQREAADIRHSYVGVAAKAEMTAHRELLLRRETLAKSVFSAVRAQLERFTLEPAYRGWLLKTAEHYARDYDHRASVVQLREKDLGLADALGEIFSDCKVEASDTVEIGGFLLRNSAAKALVDETLGSRLESSRAWFLMESGLTIKG